MPITFRARIQQNPNDPLVSVRMLVADEVATLSKEQAVKELSPLVQQIRLAPEFIIHGFETHGSYGNPLTREILLGYNTLVEVNLPYTVHLPNEMPFSVKCPNPGKATIVIHKTWTAAAEGSNVADFYADDRLLYHGPSTYRTPTLPQQPGLGPRPHFTGANIEVDKDTYGSFRYTKVFVFFDSSLAGLDFISQNDSAATAISEKLNNTRKTAMEIINQFLDVYRYVANSQHVERLSTMTVTRVYFADHNFLSEGATIDSGLGSAVMNRSALEIERIAAMLRDGKEPPRHNLLLQSARAALDRGQHVLAVVVAFQALEILLETKLRDGYAKLGVAHAAIIKKLGKRYKTRDRLTTLCREVTGRSVADDTGFWSTWLVDCNRKRNGVVHRNEPVTQAEAQRVVDLCDECANRLLDLPFPV